MKPTELRLGNLFIEKHSQTIIEVIELKKDGIVFSGEFKGEWQWVPIQLTKEWLLKLGFKGINNGDFIKEVDNGWNIVWQACGFIYLKYMELEAEVSHQEYKHVHQLQNLYYALTGEELEIQP